MEPLSGSSMNDEWHILVLPDHLGLIKGFLGMERFVRWVGIDFRHWKIKTCSCM